MSDVKKNEATPKSTAIDVPPAEKMFRANDLLFDRGWTRAMQRKQTPTKVVSNGKNVIKHYSESSILAKEAELGFTPVSRPRPTASKRAGGARTAGRTVTAASATKRESAEGLTKRAISGLSQESQRRIISLQSSVPFYTPLNLQRVALRDYNEQAVIHRKTLVNINTTPTQIVDVVKIRFLEREITKRRPSASRIEILRAIKIVYPYLASQVDAYVDVLSQRTVTKGVRTTSLDRHQPHLTPSAKIR